MANILITGASDFIGFHLSKKLQSHHNLFLVDKMDMDKTRSDSWKLIDFIGNGPNCELEEGVADMGKWFKNEDHD